MLVQTVINRGASLLQRIGKTPIVPLKKFSRDLGTTVLGKAEMMNPGGSIKDRLAISLIEAAERDGSLQRGGTVIEVTSGNTGIAVSWICAAKGYKSIIVMSDKNSKEKQNAINLFGSELVITSHEAKPDDPNCNYKTAERLAGQIPKSIYLDQYNNPANIDCHYEITGPEIWEQTDGDIDCFIAGAGTGGTISGVGRFLKERNPDIKIIAVDSQGSLLTSYFKTGKLIEPEHYEVEGIGSDKLIGAMDFSVVDEFIQISDKEAFMEAREFARTEGVLAGGSSGAVLAAARKYLAENKHLSCPVVILADSGDRYLSKIYNDEWMAEKGYIPKP